MTTQADTHKTYFLDGTFLEACSCAGPCPCSVGDDPDGGHCDTVTGYHIDRGQIQGVDVSGLSLVHVAQIPGNISAGNWRLVIYIDDQATAQQQQAIFDAFGGKLGGPLAELAALISEVVTAQAVPIEYHVEEGKGTLRVGETIEAEMTPYAGASGRPTILHDSTLSTGSPTYIGKASRHRVNLPEHGMTWEFSGRNATSSRFHYEV